MDIIKPEEQKIYDAIGAAIDYFNEKEYQEHGTVFFNPDPQIGGKDRARIKQEIFDRLFHRPSATAPIGDDVEVEIRVSGIEHAHWHNRYHLGPLRKELIPTALEQAMHKFAQDISCIIQHGADGYEKNIENNPK